MSNTSSNNKVECGVLGCETSKPITCMGCNFISCIKCTQTFILSQSSAKCMSCNREYSEDYLREYFSKSWMTKEYAEWKKNKLLEREKSLLPETVEYLNDENLKKEIANLISQLKIERLKVKAEIEKQKISIKEKELNFKVLKRDKSKKDSDELKHTINDLQSSLHTIQALLKRNVQLESQANVLTRSLTRNNNDRFSYKNSSIEDLIKRANQFIRKVVRKNGKIEYHLSHFYIYDEDGNIILNEDDTQKIDEKQERKAFIKPCPADGCRGFLSTKWICGLCNTVVCKDCHEIKGKKEKLDISSLSSPSNQEDEENEENKLRVVGNEVPYEDDFNHKCNPNNIETAKALQKETKGCPKCGIRIFKIDGCFAPETNILMWDQSIKYAKDIIVGDELVGDDNKKRTVLKVVNGVSKMFNVIQSNGTIYKVNEYHKLVIKKIREDGSTVTLIINLRNFTLLSDKHKNMCKGIVLNENFKEEYVDIKVESCGENLEPYYGFEVNDNHLFLLPDKTIVSNCDQMFCTGCHTAFSWRTGQVETGTIHNPHYFQYLRQQGLQIPRPNHPDANPDAQFELLCGQVATVTQISNYIFSVKNNKIILKDRSQFTNILYEIERYRHHVNNIINPQYRWQRGLRTEYNPEEHRDLRIKYLNKTIDEKHWNMVTMKRYKKLEFNKMLSNLCQTLVAVFGDFLNNCLTLKDITINNDEFFKPIFNFIDYFNQESNKYTLLFGYSVNPFYIIYTDTSQYGRRNTFSFKETSHNIKEKKKE